MSNAKDLEAVDRLLEDAGVAPHIRDASAKELEDVKRQVAEQLEKIAKAATDEEEGGTKIVVRGVSIRLSGTIWPLVVTAVKLGIAAHDPTGITWKVAAEQTVEFLGSVAELVHKLDPSERLVCAAVSDVRGKHKAEHVAPDGASRADIEAWFEASEYMTPPDLDKLIEGLVKKGGLQRNPRSEAGRSLHDYVLTP